MKKHGKWGNLEKWLEIIEKHGKLGKILMKIPENKKN